MNINRQMWHALSVCGLFIVLNVIINGTIPFVLGADLHNWTYSITKNILFSVLLYYGVFLVIQLILIKGWQIVSQPVWESLMGMLGPSIYQPVLDTGKFILFRFFGRATIPQGRSGRDASAYCAHVYLP